MQFTAVILAALPLVQQALASLNCTVVAPVTARECEWDGCKARATANVGDVLHAGCRADCSTFDSPWLQLYDGSFIKTNELVANCRYFCKPYAITGLPTCAWEHNVTDPGLSLCAASSIMGVANKLATTLTLGTEPAPAAGIPTAGTACDWMKTPASLAPATTKTGGLLPPSSTGAAAGPPMVTSVPVVTSSVAVTGSVAVTATGVPVVTSSVVATTTSVPVVVPTSAPVVGRAWRS